MNQSIESNRIITGSLFILAVIAVAFILNFTQPIMVPFVIALLIRILIDPIIDFQIDNLRVHRIVAVFVSLCLIVFLFIIIVPFIISSVVTFLQSADDYNAKVLLLIDMIISKLQEYEINIDRETIRNSLINLPLLDWASAILSNSANIISKFILVVIMTLFLLLGKKSKEFKEIYFYKIYNFNCNWSFSWFNILVFRFGTGFYFWNIDFYIKFYTCNRICYCSITTNSNCCPPIS